MSKRKPFSGKTASLLVTLVVLVVAFLWQTRPWDPDYQPPGRTMPQFAMHVIDVGQGDSILLECGGETMLVDASTAEDGAQAVAYLNRLGIETLDIVAATHPHSDHIGGMEQVFEAFDVERFIMPRATHNTSSFERMLDAVQREGCAAEYAYTGCTYTLGEATITVLSPAEDFTIDNLNNYSLVMLVEYNGTRFLLTGDAENDIGETLQCGAVDVLKVSHHGSSNATNDAIMQQLQPRAMAVSCGLDNDYGHPHREVVALAKAYDVPLYRTDEQGTIVFTIEEGQLYVGTER